MRPFSQVAAHVDGSCRNGGTQYASAGIGAILKLDNARFARISIPCKGPERESSTVAEMDAALFALDFGVELSNRLLSSGYSSLDRLIVYSDCEHFTKGFSGELSSNKFPRLWAEINSAKDRLDRSDVDVYAVEEPAHAGYPGNDEADRLAKRASRRFFHGRWRLPRPYVKCLLTNCSGSRYIETAAELAEHVCAEHIEDMKAYVYTCEECEGSFQNYNALAYHFVVEHSEISPLEGLGNNGSNNVAYNDEEVEEIDDTDADCVFCQRVYYADDILRHLHAEHYADDDEYMCRRCGDTFVGRHFLAQHVHDGHNDVLSDSEVTPNSDEDSSGEGSEVADGEDGDDKSEVFSNGDDDGFPSFDLYECCFCDHYSSSEIMLERHWDVAHSVEKEGPILQCSACDLYFPEFDLLSRHCHMWHGINL